MGGDGKGEKRESGEKGREPSLPNLTLFSLPPYPLPLSTPATQANFSLRESSPFGVVARSHVRGKETRVRGTAAHSRVPAARFAHQTSPSSETQHLCTQTLHSLGLVACLASASFLAWGGQGDRWYSVSWGGGGGEWYSFS